MDSFSIESTFTADDWRAYQATLAQKLQGDGRLQLQITLFLSTALVVALLYVLSLTFPRQMQLGAMSVGATAGLGAVWIRWWLLRRNYRPDPDGMMFGPRTMTFGSDGMTIQRSNTSTFMSWSLLKKVEIEPRYLFIWLDRTSALALPLRDLPPGMTAEEAATRIRRLASQAATPTSEIQQPSISPPLALDRTTPRPESGALRRAIGFLTLRPHQSATGAPTDWAIAGFTVGSLILWLALDRLSYGNSAEFVPYDAPGFAWYMLPFLLAAWLASRLTRPRVEIRKILFLLVVLAPVLIGCAFLLSHNVPRRFVIAVAVALVVYALVYLEVGLRALSGRRQPRAASVVIAIALLFVVINSTLFVYPSLWIEPNTDTFEARAERTEDLLISQGPRIEAEVGNVAAAHPGVYFVGFAGVGRQRVFAEEIKLAAQRIADRYDSAQREVLLVNDRRDVDSHPLATVEGLKLTLKDIAARMDVEQDVLFLALSSHGSDEPTLSVSNTGVSLRDLSGSDLADALRASGIKWKVIVISACHAGAFIDALRDDNTIVLTAAAADRTSFGCSDDRDLTYFGEAFYRDALPRSATLQEAFSQATADIASREKREGVRASNPQAFFGTAMEKKLAQIDRTARCNTGCRQSVPESHPIRSTQRRDQPSL